MVNFSRRKGAYLPFVVAKAITALGRVRLDQEALIRYLAYGRLQPGGRDSACRIAGDDLARDLADVLGTDTDAVLSMLTVLGGVIKERALAGKPSGIPACGTLYIDTKPRRGRISRRLVFRRNDSLRNEVSYGAPFTESFATQIAHLREKIRDRKREKEETTAS